MARGVNIAWLEKAQRGERAAAAARLISRACMALLRVSFDILGLVAWSQHHKRGDPILSLKIIAEPSGPIVLTLAEIETLLGSCRPISLDASYD
jgi:hypothetical protein